MLFAKRCAASDESFFWGLNKEKLLAGVKQLAATGWGEPAEGAGGAGCAGAGAGAAGAGAGASEARSPWLDLLGHVEDLKTAVSQAKPSNRVAVECCVSGVWKRSILERKGANECGTSSTSGRRSS